MKKKKLSPLLLLCFLFSQTLFKQASESESSPTFNDTLPLNKTLYPLIFTAQSSVDSLFGILSKTFGPAFRFGGENSYHSYKCYNKSWAKEEIHILAYTTTGITNSDSSISEIILISVSTNRKNLIEPGTNSRTKIKEYFFKIFDNSIKKGKADIFD